MAAGIPSAIGLLVLQATTSAPQSRPGLDAELARLDEDHAAAQTAFFAKLEKLDDDDAQAKLFADPKENPGALFLPRYRALAERAKGTDLEMTAIVRMLELAPRSGMDPKDVQSSLAPAVAAAVAAHLASKDAERFVRALGVATASHAIESAAGESALRKFAASAPERRARAAAMISLGDLLLRGAEARRPDGRALFETLARDYADTSYGIRAKGWLFEHDHLQIGMVAPDFTAKDQDGKTFRLSDYRGRVVVLDFWGFW